MSASAGGRTTPSETPSAIATTASASAACAISAICATGSITPKKIRRLHDHCGGLCIERGGQRRGVDLARRA